MSEWLIALTGVAYVFTCIDLALKGDPWLGLTFFGYALGNMGLFMKALGH